jgi:hypothetical protein
VGRVNRIGVIALLAVLGACPHKNGGMAGTPGFAISYPDAGVMSTPAKVGKHFSAKPAGQCFRDDGTEGRWAMSGAKLTSGELPPGLTLEDGEIAGVPKAAGTFKATIELGEVTCAGKPYPGQTVSVLITVK